MNSKFANLNDVTTEDENIIKLQLAFKFLQLSDAFILASRLLPEYFVQCARKNLIMQTFAPFKLLMPC